MSKRNNKANNAAIAATVAIETLPIAETMAIETLPIAETVAGSGGMLCNRAAFDAFLTREVLPQGDAVTEAFLAQCEKSSNNLIGLTADNTTMALRRILNAAIYEPYMGKYAEKIAKRGLTAENLLTAPLPSFKQASMVLAIGTESPKVNSKSVHTELLAIFAGLQTEHETVTGNILVNAMVNHNWLAGRNSAYITASLAGRMAIADWCIGYLQGALRRKYIAAK